MIEGKINSVFYISNKESGDIIFILEPWGEEFVMRPKDKFKITIQYPESSSWVPEVIFDEGRFIVLKCYDNEQYFYKLESDGRILRTSDHYE